MNESQIQLALHREFFTGCDICLPNYTPKNWWECDFFHLTKAGYMVEHEIKVTRSDFFADAKKKRDFGPFRDPKIRSKHTLLDIGHDHGPRQFWFVVPEGVIRDSEVPSFAGLKVASETIWQGRPWITIKVARKAPYLHKVKAEEEVRTHALSVCYYRYWNEKRAHDQTRKERSVR